MQTRQAHLALGGAALLFATLAAGCGGRPAAEARETAAPVVIGPENVAVVAETTLVDGPAISGTLAADKQARVRAELGGSVLQVFAEAGQSVGAGQALAQIEPQTAREAAQYSDALVASLESNLRLAQRNLDRSRRLSAGGAVSTAQMELDEQAVVQAEAVLAEARSRQVSAQRTLARSTVRAPFGGVVSARAASVGDVVQQGTELFTVVDPSSLRLEAQVPAEYLRSLKVGTPVQFRLSGFGEQALTGRVSRVVPVIDPATRQAQVLVAVPNPGRALVAGLFAEGRVITSEHRGLTVPQGALDVRGVRPSVLRLAGGKLERVEVQVGLRDNAAELVEVTGVAAGDTVMLGTARDFPAGTPARIGAAAERAAVSAQ
ncbi:MAG: efflux RND transporter periplasmic adaptor subunit [Gemmatimonadales bacterium]|nr:efflux RND transporter periplasmic adaptor subunit [Gemmatimonadales bacterium]